GGTNAAVDETAGHFGTTLRYPAGVMGLIPPRPSGGRRQGRSPLAYHRIAFVEIRDCAGAQRIVKCASTGRNQPQECGMARKRCAKVVRLSAALAMWAGLAGGAAAQDLKTWRHGIIEAKSDAGILFMASRRDFAGKLGLKLDFVQLKNDVIALKALLAG